MIANPNNAELAYWLGRSYYELRDYDNAITNGEKSVELDPKNSDYHLWLGRAYGGKADREHSFFLAKKVKKEFEDAVAANPSNIAARRDLEEFDIDAPWVVGGSKDEAKAQVDAIAAIDPVQGHLAQSPLRCRGGSRSRTPPKANTARHSLRSPRQWTPISTRPTFFEKQNKPSDMKAAIDGAAAVNPNDPRLAYYRGVYGVLSSGRSLAFRTGFEVVSRQHARSQRLAFARCRARMARASLRRRRANAPKRPSNIALLCNSIRPARKRKRGSNIWRNRITHNSWPGDCSHPASNLSNRCNVQRTKQIRILERDLASCLQALRANKLRAALTMLGVIIGSGCIVLVVTVALAGKRYIVTQIEGVGSNLSTPAITRSRIPRVSPWVTRFRSATWKP